MRYKPGDFAVTPNLHIIKDLPAPELKLYIFLCSYADNNGECFPARKTLAHHMGYKTLRSISRLVQNLEKHRLIQRVKKSRPNGSQMANGYQIMLLEEEQKDEKVLFNDKGVEGEKTPPPCPTADTPPLSYCGQPPLSYCGHPFNIPENTPLENIPVATRKKRAAKSPPKQSSGDTTKKTAKKKKKAVKKKKPYKSVSDPKQIVEIIDLFIEKKINTTVAKRWYGDNTQRKAIDDLIQIKGFQELKDAVVFLPAINKQGYFANVTTPNQLLYAWDKILNSIAKQNGIQQAKHENQITKVII